MSTGIYRYNYPSCTYTWITAWQYGNRRTELILTYHNLMCPYSYLSNTSWRI